MQKRTIFVLLTLLVSLNLPAKRIIRHIVQRGKASFYKKKADGSRTASGAILHNDSLTCAHKTLPFGTKLLVTCKRTGKEVVVTVNDRGPHRPGRIIDLSYAAAKQLGIINKGIATVEIRPYHPNKGIPFLREDYELPELDFAEILPQQPAERKYPMLFGGLLNLWW